jgi:hypothetical protein
MTNKEKALALWAIATDPSRPQAERKAAVEEVHALKKSAKTSYEKLGLNPEEVAAHAHTLGDDWEASQADLDAQAPRQELKADPLEELPAEQVAEIKKVAKAAGENAVAQVDAVLAAGGVTRERVKLEPEVRGAISLKVRELLSGTELPYSEIVETVKRDHPHAVTTTRSVASVASEMRAKGEKVPTRRVPAKEKK